MNYFSDNLNTISEPLKHENQFSTTVAIKIGVMI